MFDCRYRGGGVAGTLEECPIAVLMDEIQY
jgi:hypothetical protein